ncbi:MAG: zinc-ribbon and DUF3426 domain-containing protein [Betaproteobacteria bacterium]|nr:zinc-ribbon and DUF3426 domain-containing protein [Betaproteobacteria bacterium]
MSAPPPSPPTIRLYTRCTFCFRAFRITEEQLAARKGQVRCGKCQAVFNAHDHLIRKTEPEKPEPGAHKEEAKNRTTPEATATVDERSTTVRPAPPIQAVPPVTVRFSAANDEETLSIGADTIIEALPPPPRTETPKTARPEEKPEAEISWEKLRESLRKSRRSRNGEEEPPPADPETPPETPSKILPETPPEILPETKGSTESEKEDEELEQARRLVLHALHQDKKAEQPPPQEQEDNASDAEEKPRRRSFLPAFLLGFVVFVLTLLLSGQAAYYFRGELALALPATRPWLETACAHLQPYLYCAIPLPRRSEYLDIASSDFASDPTHRGHILLSATLVNRAPFAQDWPSLEITLTDVYNYAVLRRILSPAEYLPLQKTTSFAAHGEIAVELHLEIRDAEPVGYRIEALYP